MGASISSPVQGQTPGMGPGTPMVSREGRMARMNDYIYMKKESEKA